VWLAVGRTDMRKGMNGLALQVQERLQRDPHAGDLYVFCGKRGHLIKILPDYAPCSANSRMVQIMNNGNWVEARNGSQRGPVPERS
jgi:transposase